MNTTQLAREPCRQVLHRTRISVISSQPFREVSRPARCTFSTTTAFKADEEDGKSAKRIRQAKAPTRLRREMYRWFNGPGRQFIKPLPGQPNLLPMYNREGQLKTRATPDDAEAETEVDDAEAETDVDDIEGDDSKGTDSSHDSKGTDLSHLARTSHRVFPLNGTFTSQPVLSEALRNAIHRRVAVDGQSVSAVSADLKVDMRRVAAVVRLKEVEKSWENNDKPFADAYANAVMTMLPQTPYNPERPFMHESINDLPVHPATKQQIFYPTSESRPFTRRDAAKVFAPSLLTADERVPHPELIEAERQEQNEPLSQERKVQIAEEIRRTVAKSKAQADSKRRAAEAARTTVVKGSRWNFRFESVDAGLAGKDGRDPAGVGWRYGMPNEDRKRGHFKGVPTKVEV